MDDVLTIARDWGSWAGAALALAIALRTHATSSARTVEQLRRWLVDAQREIGELRTEVRRLELLLEACEERSEQLAQELVDLRRDVTAGSASATRASSLVRPAEGGADVVPLRAAAARDGGDDR